MTRGPLLAPGVRTGAGRDWRSGALAALSATTDDPPSWLLGLLGFLARGGALVLALPIVTVPSPVLLSILFRGEVGAVGRDAVLPIALVIGSVLSVAVVGAVVVSAWADVTLAERLVRRPETADLRLGRSPRPLAPAARRSLVWRVASVQAVALVPLIVALTWLVLGAARAATDELIRPSTEDLSLYARVLPLLLPPLLLVVAVLVLTEALSSLVTRRLMVSAWGLQPHGPPRPGAVRLALEALERAVRQPGRVAATALAGWLALGVGVALVMLASLLAWGAVRDVLITGRAGLEPVVLVVAGLLVALFVAIWTLGLGLVGLVAAVRGGLWTADALR